MKRQTILVVDDQESHRELTHSVLAAAGFLVQTASSGAEALTQLRTDVFGLVLTDQLMPGMSGLELMGEIRSFLPDLPVVIVTGHGTIDTAVNAMKTGAADFIQKPFSPEELLLVVRRVLERQELMEEVRTLRVQVGDQYRFDRIISKSPKMTEVFGVMRNLADLDTTVLITGETGTGKELAAHAIHMNSNRRAQRFVRINCGALSESLLESELFGHERGAFTGAVQARRGKFEYAAGGMLLLDEIGDISVAMQVKLLRVLQEKEIQRVGGNETIPVDVRILATTNKDLEKAVATGSFRSDLYYRLNVVRIHLPPLRERMEDVPLLAESFLRTFCEKTGRKLRGISQTAMRVLLDSDWPGNVRELANVIERAAVMATGEMITDIKPMTRAAPVCIPTSGLFRPELSFKDGRQQVVMEYEKAYIMHCLRLTQGNIAQSAQQCGIDAKTFYRKMQEYALDKRDFRRSSTATRPFTEDME